MDEDGEEDDAIPKVSTIFGEEGRGGEGREGEGWDEIRG